MGRVLVIGDIHGNYKGLMQCLERSNFDYENDTLISLGDLVDGHSESYEVIEELLKIKNLICIKGNHDVWFNEWIKTGKNPTDWKQGQKATGLSYLKHKDSSAEWYTYRFNQYGSTEMYYTIKPEDVPESHKDLFNKQIPYYIDEDNNLFIHGGFNRHEKLEDQFEHIFYWDRDLWSQALTFESMKNQTAIPNYKPSFKMVDDFKEIFIGHTSTQFWDENEPMNAANIWNLDTGGGWYGKITIMNPKTKEFWQSDDGKTLYPEFKGRS